MAGPANPTVTLVVRLCVADPSWPTFQQHLARFLAECARFEGHLDVSIIKEEAPVGVCTPWFPGYTVLRWLTLVVHPPVARTHMVGYPLTPPALCSQGHQRAHTAWSLSISFCR